MHIYVGGDFGGSERTEGEQFDKSKYDDDGQLAFEKPIETYLESAGREVLIILQVSTKRARQQTANFGFTGRTLDAATQMLGCKAGKFLYYQHILYQYEAKYIVLRFPMCYIDVGGNVKSSCYMAKNERQIH
jgi:hypothetical protein